MRVLTDSRWIRTDGIGRFASETLVRIQSEVVEITPPIPLLSPLEQVWIPARLFNESADLFFTPGINPPILSTIPFVFVIHDLIPLTFSEETSLFKKLYYNVVLRIAVRRAKMVLTVSEFSKREIIDHFGLDPEKIAVVGNGVDERFRPDGPTQDRGEPYLLYVGNTRPHKNVEAAIEGYAQSGVQDQVRLLLSGSPTPSLMEVVRVNGVEEAVDFADFIPEEELPAYYRGATALVHPSLHEGFGLPVLEALACGTAVVASNATAIPEVTGDAAHLFDPTNIGEIASAIRKVVLNDSFRTSLEERGPERAKKFSWKGVARRTESALRAAVA